MIPIMVLKKVVVALGLVCLLNVFSISVALANPILKADEAQLERWDITQYFVDAKSDAPPDVVDYIWIIVNIHGDLNIVLKLKDIANPAVKMHLKKIYGVPITPEDIAMANKKWSANPILEADDTLYLKWFNLNDCKLAFTVPGEDKFTTRGVLELCSRTVIPMIMMDTGVEVSEKDFASPEAIARGKKVFAKK